MKKHVKQNLSKQLTFQLIILKKKYIQKTSQIIEIIPEILKQFVSYFSFLKGTNQYKISEITSITVNTSKTVFLASITLHLRNYFLTIIFWIYLNTTLPLFIPIQIYIFHLICNRFYKFSTFSRPRFCNTIVRRQFNFFKNYPSNF